MYIKIRELNLESSFKFNTNNSNLYGLFLPTMKCGVNNNFDYKLFVRRDQYIYFYIQYSLKLHIVFTTIIGYN